MKKLIILLIILFFNGILFAQDQNESCQKQGEVYISFKNYNINMNIPEDLGPKKISVGFSCKGFQTRSISPTDNITTCTYDPDTISCYVSTDVLWLEVPDEPVKCNSNFNISINLNNLVMNLDQTNYTGTIKVVCSNGFSTAGDIATVNLSLNINKEKLIINPPYLYWSAKKLDNNTIDLPKKIIKISGIIQGLSYKIEDDWLNVNILSSDNSSKLTSLLEVTPDLNYFSQAPLGVYQTTIHIYDKLRNIEKSIPVVVQIRDSQDPIIIPISYIQDNQSIHYYSFNLSDAEKFYIYLNTKEFFDYLGNYQFIGNKKTYVIFYLPDIAPNTYFTYVPWHPYVFVPIKQNGKINPDADSLYYSKGFINDIKIGPYSLRGIKGRIEVYFKVGDDYQHATTIEETNFNIYSFEGRWNIIDEYEGITYPHNEKLKIWRENGTLKGCFVKDNKCDIPVIINYDNGYNGLYNIYFNTNNYFFSYQIKKLTENTISGQWKWCNKHNCSKNYNFYGFKEFKLSNY